MAVFGVCLRAGRCLRGRQLPEHGLADALCYKHYLLQMDGWMDCYRAHGRIASRISHEAYGRRQMAEGDKASNVDGNGEHLAALTVPGTIISVLIAVQSGSACRSVLQVSGMGCCRAVACKCVELHDQGIQYVGPRHGLCAHGWHAYMPEVLAQNVYLYGPPLLCPPPQRKPGPNHP